MKPTKHKASGLWCIRVPPRLSDTGRWSIKYFTSRAQAHKAIEAIKNEKAEHGKSAVTAEERRWINVARTELGSLESLREVLDHWRLTGAGVVPISANEAAERFISFRIPGKLSKRTQYDICWRCRAFGKAFGETPLHSITPGAIERWLHKYAEGWSRKSMDKRIRPLFAYAKRNRFILQNPMDELDPPETPRERKEIYTPEEYRALLNATIYEDEEVCFFLVLAGMAFVRSREMLKTFKSDSVIEWRDIRWDDDPPTLHIRDEVAKATRRKSGGERFTPLHRAVIEWLEPYKDRIGPIIPVNASAFRQRLHKIFAAAGVEFKPNALRHSAISSWLAAYEFGVGQVSKWSGNSESACNLHYVKSLRKDQGLAWFASGRP
jgi:site-specific recombinase XerD